MRRRDERDACEVCDHARGAHRDGACIGRGCSCEDLIESKRATCSGVVFGVAAAEEYKGDRLRR